MLGDVAVSTLVNLVILGGIPFLAYWAYQRWRKKRTFREVAQRVGLQLGERRYLAWSLALALIGIVILVLWPPPLAAFQLPQSPQRPFRGLGLAGPAVPMALLYGLLQTGFTEELLFRGLVAGSLSRRLRLAWANFWQAAIFLAPHLLLLRVMPEMWGFLPMIFLTALALGWLRIKSGSIVGPWLVHGSTNVAVCLSVAIRTVS